MASSADARGASPEAGPAVPPAPPRDPALHHHVRTVLLCDDQQVLRDAISLLLMNFPRYRVVGEAIDAAGCLQAIADLLPDILIMDVSMPGGGRDLVRAARAQRANMHIVMFSGRHEPSVQAEMIAAGADVYVIKTGRLKPLIEALDSCAPRRPEPEDSAGPKPPTQDTQQPVPARTDRATGLPRPHRDPPRAAPPSAPLPLRRPTEHPATLFVVRARPGDTPQGPGRHRVFCYANDRELIPELVSSASTALAGDGHFIAIATPAHRAALRAGLPPAIVERACSEGRFLELDAGRALEQFMRDGLPDQELFDRTIGAAVLAHAAGDTAVLTWGEMVALLWEQGNVLGTLRLEQLWNRLLQRVGFDLVCAYPLAELAPLPNDEFAEIRDLHEWCRDVDETEHHRVG